MCDRPCVCELSRVINKRAAEDFRTPSLNLLSTFNRNHQCVRYLCFHASMNGFEMTSFPNKFSSKVSKTRVSSRPPSPLRFSVDGGPSGPSPKFTNVTTFLPPDTSPLHIEFLEFVSVQAHYRLLDQRKRKIHTTWHRRAQLGIGASFNVQEGVLLNRYTDKRGRTWDKGTLVAYKAASAEDSSGKKTRNLQELVTEIRALCHDPLRYHNNIVHLFGVAWQEDERAIVSRDLWPALTLEIASPWELPDDILVRHKLCVDVAKGLEVSLHTADLVDSSRFNLK